MHYYCAVGLGKTTVTEQTGVQKTYFSEDPADADAVFTKKTHTEKLSTSALSSALKQECHIDLPGDNTNFGPFTPAAPDDYVFVSNKPCANMDVVTWAKVDIDNSNEKRSATLKMPLAKRDGYVLCWKRFAANKKKPAALSNDPPDLGGKFGFVGKEVAEGTDAFHDSAYKTYKINDAAVGGDVAINLYEYVPVGNLYVIGPTVPQKEVKVCKVGESCSVKLEGLFNVI